MLIGLAIDGAPVLGVAYQPTRDALYYARRGGGAFLESGGTAQRLAASKRREPSELRVGISRLNPDEGLGKCLAASGLAPRAVQMGASVKHMALARGDLDAVLNLSPAEQEWDTCAPEVILTEAGCTVDRRRRPPLPLQPEGSLPPPRQRREQRPLPPAHDPGDGPVPAGTGARVELREVGNARIGAVVVVGALIPAVADAHFVLQAPESWAAQDSQGNPQKTSPCGQADPQTTAAPTKAITAFQAGQPITVTIDEVVYHPGHYRVVLSTTGRDGLPADPPTELPGTCQSLAIQDPPVYPVLADGMLQHTDPLGGPQSFQVTLPNDVTCANCTLQVLEFMSAEVGASGNCFYHHCADISISAAGTDAGTDAGGAGGSGGGDAASGCGCMTDGSQASLGSMLVSLVLLILVGRRARGLRGR